MPQRKHISGKVEFDVHKIKKKQKLPRNLKRTYYTLWVRNYKTGPTDFEMA